ncbi:hypothetical protein DRO33_06305 [Candidatus Bathyarchaeota archaeon]|nr:MAG: hypothetical protein DRO33_06305 [Candidatus Bathyarchaeota archaeon]
MGGEGGSNRILMLTGQLIEEAGRLLEGISDVEFAAIIGPLAENGISYDGLELALKRRDGTSKDPALEKLRSDLATSLGLPEEIIKLRDLDEIDLYLKEKTVRNGIILLDRKGYREMLAAEVGKQYLALRDPLGELARLARMDGRYPFSISLVMKKLEDLEARADFLARYILRMDDEVVRSSPHLSRLFEENLKTLVEDMAAVCRHLILSMRRGSNMSYSEAISSCAEEGVIGLDVAEALKKGLRLRNMIAQASILRSLAKVDYDILCSGARELLAVARKFEEQVVSFIMEAVFQSSVSGARARAR